MCSWEEETAATSLNTEGSPMREGAPTKCVYNHGSTRLPNGEEGMLADTGAVDNVTGLEYVKRQSATSSTHGLEQNGKS